MSELGTVEKKSLVARFDEENIVRIGEDTVNEKFIITRIADGVEHSASVKPDGSFKFPKFTYRINNSTGSVKSFANLLSAEQYGIWVRSTYTILAGDNEINIFLPITLDGMNYFMPCVINSATVTFVSGDNCYLDGIKVVIIDPSKDATCRIKLT